VSRTLLVATIALWAGVTLLLAELRWFRRTPLGGRLGPYVPAAAPAHARPGALSAQSFRDVIGPLVSGAAEGLLRTLGVNEDVGVTLLRLHSPIDAAAFRLRQAGWTAATLGVVTLIALLTSPPPPLALLLVAGAPLLAFLSVEQRLAGAAHRRRLAVTDELPVVMEQLAMLLGAGYSLGSALNRLARRGSGAVAQDLQRVTNRVRQGLSEEAALREWASIAGVADISRLVDVLALNRHGADLARLVGEEARAARGEAHRALLETIERRAQLVWIPVTVATLVPGVLFMAVPFIEAMRNFAAL